MATKGYAVLFIRRTSADRTALDSKNVRLTKFSLAFFFFFGKIDIESQHYKTKGESSASGAGNLCFLYKYGKKGGVAMITLKDVKGIFNQLRKILAMLDKIYHTLNLDKEE